MNQQILRRGLSRESLLPYAYILPALLVIAGLLFIPIVRAVLMSLTDVRLLSIGRARFVGLANYVEFFTSPSFTRVMVATLVYVIGGVSLTYVFGMFTALILNRDFLGRGLARTILIVPWAVPQVVLVIIWQWMLNPRYGVLNYFLNVAGLVEGDFSWFSSAPTAMTAILLATLWKQYPLGMLILLAGMQSIPRELYEVAEVDGASALQRFRYITLPGLRYITSVLLLLLTIWHFGNFTIIWLMTQGGPADATATLTIFSYLHAFKLSRIGYGAAIGVVILCIALFITVLYFRLFVRSLQQE